MAESEIAQLFWRTVTNKRPEKISRKAAGYEVYTMDEFVDAVKGAFLIEDEGYACYATPHYWYHLRVTCADVFNDRLDKSFSHVVWFNR